MLLLEFAEFHSFPDQSSWNPWTEFTISWRNRGVSRGRNVRYSFRIHSLCITRNIRTRILTSCVFPHFSSCTFWFFVVRWKLPPGNSGQFESSCEECEEAMRRKYLIVAILPLLSICHFHSSMICIAWWVCKVIQTWFALLLGFGLTKTCFSAAQPFWVEIWVFFFWSFHPLMQSVCILHCNYYVWYDVSLNNCGKWMISRLC